MKEPKAKAFPTMLNKSDAMIYAAGHLDEMVSTMRLIKIIAGLKDKMPGESDPQLAEAMKDLGVQASGIIDVDVQEQAMKAAALEIRAMANEAKLADARASRVGARPNFA